MVCDDSSHLFASSSRFRGEWCGGSIIVWSVVYDDDPSGVQFVREKKRNQYRNTLVQAGNKKSAPEKKY